MMEVSHSSLNPGLLTGKATLLISYNIGLSTYSEAVMLELEL